MKKILFVLVFLGIFLVSGCFKQQNIEKNTIDDTMSDDIVESECTFDSECEQGVCQDGKKYVKYICSDVHKCALVNYARDPCEKTEKQPQIEKQTIQENTAPPFRTEATYFIGNQFEIDGTILSVSSISSDGKLTLLNNGKEFIISGTKNPAKIGSKEIMISKLNLEPPLEKRYVELVIEDILLDENEYILDFNKEITVLGKKIVLRDVMNGDAPTIQVQVSQGLEGDTENIVKGKTEEFLGLKITHIRSNSRAISYEKYAIVRIE